MAAALGSTANLYVNSIRTDSVCFILRAYTDKGLTYKLYALKVLLLQLCYNESVEREARININTEVSYFVQGW